jgi:hypothetical protein
MKNVIQLMFLGIVLGFAQPTIDGSFDGEATWGAPVATADLAIGWAGANAKKLYITYDETYMYVGAEIIASTWQGWSFLIQTKSGGGSTDSWSRNITYTHSNLPDYILRGHFNSYSEFHTWNGSSWNGVTSSYGAANFGENITGSDQSGWVEGRVLLSAMDNPSSAAIQFFITGDNNDHGSFDAVPNDDNSTDWSGSAAHSDLSQYGSITALPVELISLSTFVNGKKVELAWKTATEINNHGFEIERKQSASGSWEKIGFKEGQGTTNTATDYSFVDNTVTAGKYSYRLKQIDRDGKFEYSKSVEASVGLSPASVELSGNYPNPFNPSTSISFTLGTTGKASLKVYDLLGKEVATIAEGIYNAGELNTFNFNADRLTSGVYYYQLVSDAKVETRKMLLMK